MFRKGSKVANDSTKLKINNVLNPLLWICGLFSTPGISIYAVYDLNNIVLILVSMPIVITLIAFLFFMIKDPDRLQSEEYLIGRKSLEMISEKDQQLKVKELTDLRPIIKPDLEREDYREP